MTNGISLVMATLGRCDDVGRFIGALQTQTDKRFELIVVDQNQDERLQPFIAAGRAAGLTIVHERRTHAGLSRSRNHGLRLARYAWVAFPDDDCWYENDVIEVMLAKLSASRVDGLVAHWVERNIYARPGEPLQLEAWRKFRGRGASSITLFLNRDQLLEAGGFDERLGVGEWFGSAEETDLLLSLLQRGAVIDHCPAARVHHAFGLQRRLGWRAAMGQTRRRERGTGALYIKHRLGTSVVLRGLLAPFAKIFTNGAGFLTGLGMAFAVVLGRLEGMWRWMSLFSRS